MVYVCMHLADSVCCIVMFVMVSTLGYCFVLMMLGTWLLHYFAVFYRLIRILCMVVCMLIDNAWCMA